MLPCKRQWEDGSTPLWDSHLFLSAQKDETRGSYDDRDLCRCGGSSSSGPLLLTAQECDLSHRQRWCFDWKAFSLSLTYPVSYFKLCWLGVGYAYNQRKLTLADVWEKESLGWPQGKFLSRDHVPHGQDDSYNSHRAQEYPMLSSEWGSDGIKEFLLCLARLRCEAPCVLLVAETEGTTWVPVFCPALLWNQYTGCAFVLHVSVLVTMLQGLNSMPISSRANPSSLKLYFSSGFISVWFTQYLINRRAIPLRWQFKQTSIFFVCKDTALSAVLTKLTL